MRKSAASFGVALVLAVATPSHAQNGTPADDGWRRVRKLAAGQEISITIQSEGLAQSAVRCTVIAADDTSLTLLADLDQVIRTIPREDVDEIVVHRKGRGFWGHLGLLGGYFVGGTIGGYVAGAACTATSGASRCDNGAYLIGALAGGIAGGAWGAHAARRETPEVIYQRDARRPK